MELRNYMLNSSVDLVDCVIDEVALEGLDGITLEALWQRMALRLHEDLPLTDSLMEQIWSTCSKVKGFMFYELKKAREPLIIFDRFELLNEDEKKAKIPKDIYPHFPIDDLRNGVRGSCSSYNTRVDITLDARYYALEDIISNYGQKFVIVASQTLRERALVGDTACPVMEMNVLQYCFLERVGRARYHGDVSSGKTGIGSLSDDPKTLFYHRKFLLKQKLITKQAYSERVSGNSYSGSLLHLTRFYVERRPKFILLSERIINYLKSKDKYISSYDELKEKLELKIPLKKIFKTPILKTIIRTDIKVPYRDLNPNFADSGKNANWADKIVRAVELVDPNIDINQFWGKHDAPDEDESYDLNTSKQKLNIPYLKQANCFVEDTCQQGLSQTELGTKLGMTKLHTRTILRNLVKTRIVATYMNDIGKQRVTKYIAKKFEHSSEMSKQLTQEIAKMKQFNRTSQEEKNNDPSPNVPVNPPTNPAVNQLVNPLINPLVNPSVNSLENPPTEIPQDVIYPMDEDVHFADEVQNYQVQRDEQLFASVNKIFSKYKNLRSRTPFRYTCLNLAQLRATAFWNPSAETFETPETQNQTPSNQVQNPIPMNCNVFKDVKTKIVASNEGKKKGQITGFLENFKNSNNNKKNVTYRILKRANLIIEAVKQKKVIDDTSKLLKMIKEEEDKEGYFVRIDKRSLSRVLQRLAKDNLVKYIKLTLSDNTRQKVVTYICDPSIDKNHSLIQSAVEQAKIRFCLLRAPVVRASKKYNSSSKQQNLPTLFTSDSIESADVNLFLDHKVGKKYGYSPKFLRMKALHNLLFYLVYEHRGEIQSAREEQLEKFREEGIFIDEELETKMNEIYTNEISWKMFIPPLPEHFGWANGWALMCDVLIRLPLSIFVKVYNIPYVIPDLESYLDHPIKKHFLVKDISPFLRNILLKSRKYIFVIHETIQKLCYLGLVQFGPQKLKEKDQFFLFINRHSQLLDTTSSSVSYHRIEDKSYPVRKYEFKSLLDVDKYWYDMWEICVHTSLGGRLAVQGKDILLEDLPKKAEMIKATKPRLPHEVHDNDNGQVPGDHQGAAGFDSALFAHLKRNWTWGHNNYTYQQYKTTHDFRKNVPDSQPKSLEEAIQDSTYGYPKEVQYKKVKPKATVSSNTDKEAKSASKPPPPSKVESKKKSYVRRVLPRKTSVRKRVKYDEVDYKALQRMDKLRVDWEPHEDNILLMCKVAMMYLFPNPRKQFVTFIAVRDTLRTYSNCSNNKTSRACQRRLLYMLKQPQTISSVMLGIEEIKQNYFVNKRFNGLVDRIKSDCHNPVEYEEKVAKIFKELVAYISKKYYDISNMEPRDPVMVPQTIQAFNLIYDLRHPSKVLHPKGFTKDVKSLNDIYVAVINAVIHSSMCSGKDRRSWAYQLFKIYQQYSEANLRAAIFKIRSDQMVSVRKGTLTTAQKSGNCMPMTNAQYQLSLNYYYKFQTKWPYSVFSESYNLLYKLIQWQCENQSPEQNFTVPSNVPGIEVLPITGGIVAGIHDFFAKDQLDFDIKMPEQVIMLDPRLQEKNDVYLKIAKRYQSLLMNYAYATDAAGPRAEAHYRSVNLTDIDERTEEVPAPEVMQRPLIKKGTIDDTATIESANSVFLREPQINWNEPQNADIELINVRGIKRCPDSEDEDAEPPVKRSRVEETKIEQIAKRPRIENEFNSKVQTNKEDTVNTMRQFYARNLRRAEAILGSIKEPSRSLQRAVEQEQMNETADPKLKESKKEMVDKDPLQVDHVAEEPEDFEPRPARRGVVDYYTRFGMLKMRQEYTELSLADSHHAHDFFVVNSFNIFYKLTLPNVDGPRKLDVHQGYEIPSDILPLKLNTVNNMLNKIKKNAIFPKQVMSYQEFQQIAMESVRIPWAIINAVCMFIKEKKELGVTLLDLSTTFQCIGDALYEILTVLTEYRQVLRSGVTTVRYIHKQHSDPWLIHSCKILRLEQEAQTPAPQGSVYVLNDKTNSQTNPDEIVPKQEINSPERMDQDPESDINSFDKHNNLNITKDDYDNEDEQEDQEFNVAVEIEDGIPLRRSSRQKNAMEKNKEILRVEQMFNLNPAEEVKVVIKPWIHVDGSLNRRVLDRMMGAILSYCIKHPGVMLNKIQNRFIPALQPFHTRELVEILIELGCLNVRVLKPQRVTLFSIPTDIKFSGNPGLAQEEELVIEPEIGATLRFGTYLSNKTYTSDFLT